MSQVMTDGNCPAVEELRGTLAPAVIQHVAGCRRCRALMRAAGIVVPDANEKASGPDLASVVRYRDRVALCPGDVCAAEAPGLDHRLIFVATQITDGVVDAVPIADQVVFAGEGDLLLSTDVLGYEAMAETWNAGALLIEEVAECLGKLDDARRDELAALLGRADGPPSAPSAFQSDEMDRVLPFYQGASALQGISHLGELLSRWSDRSGTTIEELAGRHGSWVTDLATHATVDLDRTAAGNDLVALLYELKVPASQRVEEIVAASLHDAEAPTVAAESGGRSLMLGLINRRAHEPDGDAFTRENVDRSRNYARRVVEQLSARQLNQPA
jgi:hypothetical protein